jgi:hypothetical protein
LKQTEAGSGANPMVEFELWGLGLLVFFLAPIVTKRQPISR